MQGFLDMLGDEEEETQPMKRQRQDDEDYGYNQRAGGYTSNHMQSNESQHQNSQLFQQFSRPSGQQQHAPTYGGTAGSSNPPNMGYMQPQAAPTSQVQPASQQSFQQLASMIKSHPQPQVLLTNILQNLAQNPNANTQSVLMGLINCGVDADIVLRAATQQLAVQSNLGPPQQPQQYQQPQQQRPGQIHSQYAQSVSNLVASSVGGYNQRTVNSQMLAARNQALQQQMQQQRPVNDQEEDKEADILAKVGKISDKLRSMLGKEGGSHGTGENSVEGAGSSQTLVKREHLIEACGPSASTLKSYQLVGINFLMMLHKSESVGGAILADEMGLGKTAQTIAFLGVLRTLCKNRNPHLIVCPASLIQNWAREFKNWCPGLKVIMYHGKERDLVREGLIRWRKKVRSTYNEGKIKELPPGVSANPADDDDANDAQDDDKDDEADYEEPDGAVMDEDGLYANPDFDHVEWDDEQPLGGLVLPDETSGEPAFDVMITTYSLFEREGGYRHDRAFLLKWKWAYLVADEAHALKNRSSIRTRNLRRVASSSQHRILLTGTPLQNSLEELRALLEFLMPSLFSKDGEAGEDETVKLLKLSDEEQQVRVEKYKTLLSPFILRRLKSEVATQLVAKKQVVKEIEMTPVQEKLYRDAVENMRREVAAAARATGGAGKGSQGGVAGRPRKLSTKAFEGVDLGTDEGVALAAAGRGRSRNNSTMSLAGSESQGSLSGMAGSTSSKGGGAAADHNALIAKLGAQRVNNIFTHLRKVAQHPLLVRSTYSDEEVARMARIASDNGLFAGNSTYERVLKEFSGYSDHQLHIFSYSWPAHLGEFIRDSSFLFSSAKIRYLDELLPSLFEVGSKVLLFSQWTMTLDILEWYMHLKGFSYVRLDGSTKVEDRLTIVDRFNDPNSGVFAFLLSTRAGGQGLNLVGADVVVLHDVDFNPQVDRQAEDRCHRLGQTKPVTVYRLVTKGTVDENVLSIADRKLALDHAVLGDVTIGGDKEGDEDATKPAGPRRGRPGLDARETRHMGAILSALLKE